MIWTRSWLVIPLVIFTILSQVISTISAEATESGSKVEATSETPRTFQCYQCGVTMTCENPFENASLVTCQKSCMKFDGFAPDGMRVIMRDCGYFEAQGCVHDQPFERNSAVGTVCHCNDDDKCNSGISTEPTHILFLVMSFGCLFGMFFS